MLNEQLLHYLRQKRVEVYIYHLKSARYSENLEKKGKHGQGQDK